MDFEDKIVFLRKRIDEVLLPKMLKKCIYLDLPYHFNIGDTLIWDGTESFIAHNHFDCIYRASDVTYRYQNVDEDTVVLLHGGGNFGDVWRTHQDFRLQVLKDYPNNKVIILPQTVYYENIELMRKDAEVMSQHSNLTICARDMNSYNILLNNFKGVEVSLLPDMAFYISSRHLQKYQIPCGNKNLLVKRLDKELSSFDPMTLIHDIDNIEIRDWPSIEKNTLILRQYLIMATINIKCKNRFRDIVDLFANKILKTSLISTGVKFIAAYQNIYTTRLHVAILSILLHKSCYIIDNSYGKNSSFYETWLDDMDNIVLLTE